MKGNWHLDAVTYKLSQLAKGYIRRLIITLPPRSLKSLCASVALPAWFLGHYPWERVVVVSYSDFLARTHANDFRRVVNHPLYQAAFPTMRLDRFASHWSSHAHVVARPHELSSSSVASSSPAPSSKVERLSM